MDQRKICLIFGAAISPIVRVRMDYSFRLFAAIYGYSVAEPSDRSARRVVYGGASLGEDRAGAIRIPARYDPRATQTALPHFDTIRYADETFSVIHGVDESTGDPDWLGEIFEWVSGGLEQSIAARDSVGRIPYSETAFSKRGLSPFKPHAALLMAWFEDVLQERNRKLVKPTSPSPHFEHAVICSHDLDFHFTGTQSALSRIGKNVLIAARDYRSASFFASNLRMAAQVCAGAAVGNYLPEMFERIESMGFRSTIFVVANGSHRRDPNYNLEEVAVHLNQAASRGFEIALHGSYDSNWISGKLRSEAARLGQVMGKKPLGSRQHWLRFNRHEDLYREVRMSDLLYDSSLGFCETHGFRNGANFALPPYDFAHERPCSFLEIPMVLMDGNLQSASQSLRADPQVLADDLLSESRKWGWGGVSILWHNPIDPIQVPEEINRVFWQLAEQRSRHAETWMTAEEFMRLSLARYHNAGLLKELSFNA